MLLFFLTMSICFQKLQEVSKNEIIYTFKNKRHRKDDRCTATRDVHYISTRVHIGPRKKKINTFVEVIYELLKILNQSQK